MSSARQAYEDIVSLKRDEAIQPVTNLHGLSGKGGVQVVPPLTAAPLRKAVQPYGRFVQLIRYRLSSKGRWQIALPPMGATR